jgi:multiple sugar transport system substrate-binding protein
MKPAKMLMGVALLAATALALSACGTSATPKATPTKAAADSVSLRMTTWTASAPQLALFNTIADSYKKTHPEIKSITFDSLPFADYTTTLTTQIAGGDAPDLAWVLDTNATDFVDSGALAPLTSSLKATSGYNYGDISSSAAKLWTQKGQLYAYPFSTSPFVVFANDTLLQQAGEPTSAQLKADGKWNWPDLAQVGSQVNAKTGQAGFIINNFNYDDWTDLATVWNAYGASPWSSDGSKCTFDSTNMTKAFTFLHDAVFKQDAMPGPGTNLNFFAKQSAFVVTQISSAGLLSAGGFNWNILPLPTGQNGSSANVIGQAGVGVLTKGKNAQEAKDFLAYFTDPGNAKQLAAYFPPPRTSLLNATTLAATNPVLNKTQINDVVIKSFQGAVTRPGHVNQVQLAAAVKTALTPMWQPNANVHAVLKSVCAAADPLLAG